MNRCHVTVSLPPVSRTAAQVHSLHERVETESQSSENESTKMCHKSIMIIHVKCICLSSK